MSDRYDFIVVGAGHNGLTAACFLAKRGRKVLIVERRETIGGLAASEEFHPGYRTAGVLNDSTAVRPWVAEALDLGKHGLGWRADEVPVLVPREEGEGLLLWRDPERAAEEISKFSAADAARYREYRGFIGRLAPLFRKLLDRVPPDLTGDRMADLWGLGKIALSLRLLGKKEMMELLRIAPMCAADWLGEWFESEILKAALAGPAIHGTYTGPWSPGSNANLLIAEAQTGRPVAGGPMALVDALEKAARSLGVEIRTGAEAARIDLADGRATGITLTDGESIEAGAVAASCDPSHLFLDLIPPHHLSRRLGEEISAYRTRGTTAKVHLALSEYPELTCRPGLQAEYLRTGETIDDLERAFDAVKYREFSARPLLDIQVPTVESPSLAPEGHHVFSILVHFAAHDLKGGWSDDRKVRLFETVVTELARYAPGVEGTIVGREILSPADLESRYGLTGGQIHHGEQATDQLLIRPIPSAARYGTPYGGLYLCGSGSHPGGGLTCVPGALAAQVMLG